MMESVLKTPMNKRRLDETNKFTRSASSIQEDESNIHMADVEEANEQYEDSASQIGSYITPLDHLDMASSISVNKLQIKAGLTELNVSINARNQRRDELIASIAEKKEELRETNERTAELRRKNEEISLMIQAMDNDEKAFYDNLKNEMDALQFLETQVLTAREQIQIVKREANRNKMKHAENMKMLSQGDKELALQKAVALREVEEQEKQCRVLQEKAKAMGDPAEVYAELLQVREQLASLHDQSEQRKATRLSLEEQLVKSEESLNQTRAKYEELVQEKRIANEAFEDKEKKLNAVLEGLRNTLEARKREKEYKEQMLALEKDNLSRVMQSLSGHEAERDAKRSLLDETVEQYEKLKEDVARLNAREQELEETRVAEQKALDKINANLHSRQLSLEQKQRELEDSIRNIAKQEEIIEEKNAHRDKLKLAIIEKQKAAERHLEEKLKQMDSDYERDLAALGEEFANASSELENKIDIAQTKNKQLVEDYELLVSKNATTTQQLMAEQTMLKEKLTAVQKEIVEFEQTRDLLKEKLAMQNEEQRIELNIKRQELEEKKREIEIEEDRRRKELEEVNKKRSDVAAERAKLEERCAAMIKRKEEAEVTLNQLMGQIEQHKNRESEQDEKIALLERQIEEAVIEEKNARDQMETLQKEMSETLTQIASCEARITEITRNTDGIKVEIEREQAKLEQLGQEENKIESEIKELTIKFEQMKLRHEQQTRNRTAEQESVFKDLLSKKENERVKFKAQYEKLHAVYENVSKANKDAADELLALRAEREKRVTSLHALMREKETLDGEYKKYQEKMLRMQKILTNLEKKMSK